MPQQDAARNAQHIAQLDKQVADLAASNNELSTDLGRALEVAKRVMDQKSKLQEQCQSQEQQLMQWQAEAQRMKEQRWLLSSSFSMSFRYCSVCKNVSALLSLSQAMTCPHSLLLIWFMCQQSMCLSNCSV